METGNEDCGALDSCSSSRGGVGRHDRCVRQSDSEVQREMDITGAAFGGDFSMPDHTGKMRSLGDFKGKVVVLFFGFTQCPDVCPTTLSEVAAALHEVGAKSNDVQVLFVTVDPERDTPELLAQYVPAFNPGFLGLRGSQAEIETAARMFKVFYQKSPGSSWAATPWTIQQPVSYWTDKGR